MKSARPTPPSGKQPSEPLTIPSKTGGSLVPLGVHLSALLAKVKPQ